MSKYYTSDRDLQRTFEHRVPTITLSQAKAILAKGSLGPRVLIDILGKEVHLAVGFESLLPKKRDITLADVHGLILPFYEVVVKAYCRSAREVLASQGNGHLKGTHVEILFPSTVKRPNAFGGHDYRLLELRSEPFLLEYPDGQISFGSFNYFSEKGIFRNDYFPIAPIIMRGREEMVAESNKVITMAAPYIFAQLKIWTKAELDVMEMLAQGRNNREIASLFGVVESTIVTHRRNAKRKIRRIFSCLNEVDVAYKLKEMGCI